MTREETKQVQELYASMKWEMLRPDYYFNEDKRDSEGLPECYYTLAFDTETAQWFRIKSAMLYPRVIYFKKEYIGFLVKELNELNEEQSVFMMRLMEDRFYD